MTNVGKYTSPMDALGEETFSCIQKINVPLEVKCDQKISQKKTNWRIFQRGKVKSTKKNNLKNTPTEANQPPPRIDPDELRRASEASACVVPTISVFNCACCSHLAGGRLKSQQLCDKVTKNPSLWVKKV